MTLTFASPDTTFQASVLKTLRFGLQILLYTFLYSILFLGITSVGILALTSLAGQQIFSNCQQTYHLRNISPTSF